MRPILSVIIFLLLISMNGILIGQEPPDSLQLTNTDSMGIDLNHPDLFSRHDFFSDSARIFYAILFFIIAFIFSIYLRQPLQRLSEKRGKYSRVIKQLIPLLLLICWFFVIYIVMTLILNLTYISSIFLILIIGIASALAFQDILKDVMAGLIVPFENHIEVGNKIQFGEIFGEIIRTGFRETQIKKSDGSIVIVSNSKILKGTVISVSADPENCPVSVDFYLPFTLDFDKCREIAHKSAIVSSYLFLDKPVSITFSNELTKDQTLVKMHVEAFLRKIEFQSLFTSELTESVIKEIKNSNAIPGMRSQNNESNNE